MDAGPVDFDCVAVFFCTLPIETALGESLMAPLSYRIVIRQYQLLNIVGFSACWIPKGNAGFANASVHCLTLVVSPLTSP